MPATLVLGGARSGKTRYALGLAQARAAETGVRPVMIATAEALDAEMAARVARHRAERSEAWITWETPRGLAGALDRLAPGDVAVVDCLTLWLSNILEDERPIQDRAAELVAAVGRCRAELWLVSNEVGQGVVPDNPLARRFRDEAGRLHQELAATVDRVVVVMAGLPLVLKA